MDDAISGAAEADTANGKAYQSWAMSGARPK